MPKGDIGSLIESYTFDATRGRHPAIVKIKDGLFCLGYEGTDNDGWSRSLNIDATGDISEPASNTFEHRDQDAVYHTACLRPLNNVVYTYTIGGGPLVFECVKVADDGTISQHAGHRVQTEAAGVTRHHIAYQRGSVVVAAHNHGAGVIYLTSVGVADTGAVTDPRLARYEVTAVLSDYPATCRVTDAINCVVCTYNDNTLYARTVAVDAGGALSDPGQVNVQIADVACVRKDLVLLKDNWVVGAFCGPSNALYLFCFQVQNDGTIVVPTTPYYLAASSQGGTPQIVVMADDVILIASRDDSEGGQLRSVQIGTGAGITWTPLDAKDLGIDVKWFWSGVLSSPDKAALAYFDGSDHGVVDTWPVVAAVPEVSHTELIIGLGP